MTQQQKAFQHEMDEAIEIKNPPLFETKEGSLPQVYEIPLNKIVPNPFQSRRNFAEAELAELTESIQEQGVVVPVCVRVNPTNPEQYQLVYGERRCRAARLAGLTFIPGEIISCTDQQMMEIGVTENIQRQNLQPLEEAQYLRDLLNLVDEETGKKKYSTRSLPKKLGKPRSYLQDRLRLLELPKDVLAILQEKPATSLRSLFEVAKLKSAEERSPLVEELREGKLTTEEVIAVIQKIKGVQKSKGEQTASEESEDLRFTRDYHKYDRRMSAALERLEALAKDYQQSHDPRQREQLFEHLKATQERLERIEKLLDDL